MLALYPQVPSPLLLSLSVWAVASGLEGEWANSSGESREEGAAERTRAPGSVRSWDLTARQKRGRQRLLPRTPTTAAQRLGSPKWVWTTGRQGGGSASPPAFLFRPCNLLVIEVDHFSWNTCFKSALSPFIQSPLQALSWTTELLLITSSSLSPPSHGN